MYENEFEETLADDEADTLMIRPFGWRRRKPKKTPKKTPKKSPWEASDIRPHHRPIGNDPRTWGPHVSKLISDAKYRAKWIAGDVVDTHPRLKEWARIQKACVAAGVECAKSTPKKKMGFMPWRRQPKIWRQRPVTPAKPKKSWRERMIERRRELQKKAHARRRDRRPGLTNEQRRIAHLVAQLEKRLIRLKQRNAEIAKQMSSGKT